MQTAPTVILNVGQQAAADAFFEFLLTDQKEFIIAGAAGVGKTTLMSYIIDTTMQHYFKSCEVLGMEPEYDEVVMTASTNKAAEVLGLAVNRPTSTIHSFMNLRVSPDFSTGKTILARTRNWTVHHNKIIFIDECSMIDSDLDQMIQEGTQDCKIVYVGDHNQLAPVFEKLSPIYTRNNPFYELTEPMRNNGQPALMDVCNQLRKTVETGVFEPIKVIPGVIDLLDDNGVQKVITDTFVPGPNLKSRILAYTNNQVSLYNQYIREERQLPHLFTVGEILVNNSAISTKTMKLSVEQEVTVTDDFGVKEVSITKDVDISVQVLNLRTSFGDNYYNVMVPTDREHINSLDKYFNKIKNWERKYYLKENFPDLRPRDAATVHKSQGSSYDSIIIDLDNISKVTQPDVAARMLYVAFSRARNRVYLYGSLAKRFGGLTE